MPDDFNNTGEKSLLYLEDRSQKSKKFVKGGSVPPPMNPSPIKGVKAD